MERDRNTTEKKLIEAVGKILCSEGYQSIGVNKVAKVAGVDKKLIYRYFGDLNGLVEAFAFEQDYWYNALRNPFDAIHSAKTFHLKELVQFFFEKQLTTMYNNRTLQKMLVWSLTEQNEVLNRLSNSRESMRLELFEKIKPQLDQSKFNFNGVFAILTAGICYLSLFSRTHHGGFCGIDVNSELGRSQITNTAKKMIELVFKSADG